MQTVTAEQIQAWKDEHGEIAKITVGNKEAYFKTPTRAAYSFASKVGATDPMEFNDIILKDCFIGGDSDLVEKERYLLTMSGHVTGLLGIMESSLEKL